MAWSTILFSALLATLTPTQAAPASPRKWTVIVGGATADTSIYANAFFPQAIEIGVGDTVTWIFEGFHNVAFLGGGAAPPFAAPEGDKMYFNPVVVLPAGENSYDGTGYHNSGVPVLAACLPSVRSPELRGHSTRPDCLGAVRS